MRVPSLRRHKPSNRAVVTLGGHDHYLGPWPAGKRKPLPEVQLAYQRLIAEWMAGKGQVKARPTEENTLAELMAAFMRHAEQHYRRDDGTQTNEVEEYRRALRPLNHLYGLLPVAEFSPLKLKAVRQLMVDGYTHPKYGPQAELCRTLINQRIGRIVRMLKWAVAEEMAPEGTWRALTTVRGLEKGRSEARETDPILPVDDAIVEATIPHLLKPVQAMVRLQRLTGMRPGEVCQMKASDIDLSGEIWLYRPERHKTRHRGKERIVALGPRAQEIIRPWLAVTCPACGITDRAVRIAWDGSLCGPCHDHQEDGQVLDLITPCPAPSGDYFLFSPQLALEIRWAELRRNRKTKVQPSQVCRKRRKPKKKRQPAYSSRSYLYAIHRAADRAGVERWHPNQLRHSHGTEVRKLFGLEAAQVALGHSSAIVTQVYAERDLARALEVARQIG